MERSKSMTCITSNNPLHQSDELFMTQVTSPDLDDPGLSIRKEISQSNKGEGQSSVTDTSKKISHRNVERKRRLDMSTLHNSLRSLLPPQHVKGKQSISDHMYAAVNYIKHLENKVKEFNAKRDMLRKLHKSIAPDVVKKKSCSSNRVIVRPSLTGMEVIITTDSRDGIPPLSSFLGLLVEEGLDVVSSVSTQSKESMLHTMQSEVTNLAVVDLSRLQRKLLDVIESARSIP